MITEGTKVKWNWGKGTATGKVQDIFERRIITTIKGTEVTRNGEPGNRALFIKQENGNEVLKLESEVKKIE